MSLYTYEPTNKKCLEGKKVFAMFFEDQLLGYRYKTPKQTIKRIQRVHKQMGVPAWNMPTLLNGWFLKESNNTYYFYENGTMIKQSKQIEGIPEGFIK